MTLLKTYFSLAIGIIAGLCVQLPLVLIVLPVFLSVLAGKRGEI